MVYNCKTGIVKAVMWNGHNESEIEQFVGERFHGYLNNLVAYNPASEQYRSKMVQVCTHDSYYTNVSVGRYIVKDNNDNLYVFDSEQFKSLFEIVKD